MEVVVEAEAGRRRRKHRRRSRPKTFRPELSRAAAHARGNASMTESAGCIAWTLRVCSVCERECSLFFLFDWLERGMDRL